MRHGIMPRRAKAMVCPVCPMKAFLNSARIPFGGMRVAPFTITCFALCRHHQRSIARFPTLKA